MKRGAEANLARVAPSDFLEFSRRSRPPCNHHQQFHAYLRHRAWRGTLKMTVRSVASSHIYGGNGKRTTGEKNSQMKPDFSGWRPQKQQPTTAVLLVRRYACQRLNITSRGHDLEPARYAKRYDENATSNGLSPYAL